MSAADEPQQVTVEFRKGPNMRRSMESSARRCTSTEAALRDPVPGGVTAGRVAGVFDDSPPGRDLPTRTRPGAPDQPRLVTVAAAKQVGRIWPGCVRYLPSGAFDRDLGDSVSQAAMGLRT